MFQPAQIDGRTVVVLRPEGHGHVVVESGRLTFDGDEVSLVAGDSRRSFSDTEIDSLKLVVAGNRIPECHGFDLFLIR